MARQPTAARKIRIMISSQCNRRFPDGGRTLTEIRRDIRDRIERGSVLGQELFEVWINEDAPGRGTDVDSWDACLAEVRKADILIVLNAGHGGWAPTDGDIGICHAELMTAQDASPGKVHIIPIRGSQPLGDELTATNLRFEAYVDRINPFSPPVTTEADLIRAVDRAIVNAVASLVELGVRSAAKGGFSTGDALAWSRLSFGSRAARMRATMVAALVESGGKALGDDAVQTSLGEGTVVFHLHASPASLAVATSRELVGRPFLVDHRLAQAYGADLAGPVHIIACQGSATETQARTLLGFPDATIVTPGFGIFAADEIQQIQFVLLKDCRDDTTIRNALHRLRAWLAESGEDALVFERAKRRRAIVDVIAAQLPSTSIQHPLGRNHE